VADKGIHRSRRMQGFPPEGYEPLPPNSPEDTYHEEVENHSDAGSAATPLLANPERDLVTVQEGSTLPANPTLEIPHDPLLVRVDSSGNIVVEDHPILPSRPYNQLDMEPIQPTFNEEYTTPVCSTEMVDPQQTPVHSIWRTPSSQIFMKNLISVRPLFDPPHASTTIGADAGPSGQPIDHPVNQIINPATTSGQVKSETRVMLPSHLQSTLMVTPTIPLQEQLHILHKTLLGHLHIKG
jgi:hypothetical protein